MTDTPALPAPETSEPVPEPPPPEPRGRTKVVPWFYAFGFLVLAGAIAYLWVNTPPQNAPAAAADQQAIQQQLQNVEGQLQTVQEQLQNVRQQLQNIEPRLTRLEQRPVPPDLSARVDALEQRPAPADTTALAARLTALEQRADANSQLASRYDTLAARVDALSGKTQSGEADLDHRIDALDARLNALSASTSQVNALDQRAARMARVQAAMAALQTGHKLGDLPNAPPALARYATINPPTEAELRLAFPAVAQAVLAASQPDTNGKPLLDRVWQRAQTLVTVREGDDVVVGDPASGIVARARTSLDAGDLAGAVGVLSDLKGPSAQAAAHWVSDAKALLAARAALTEMAEQS